MDRKSYSRPELVAYGRVDQLTLGQTGDTPDHLGTANGTLINNICNPGVPHPGLVCTGAPVG
jgi:hypothetical protein